MKNTRLIIIIVLVITALLFIIQNQGYVDVRLFVVSIRMPMVLLLLVTTGIGILLGILLAMTGKAPKLKK